MRFKSRMILLGCLAACSSNKSSVQNSRNFESTFAGLRNKSKIKALESRKANKGLSVDEEAALAALKSGGDEETSQRAAELTAKKYSAEGLSEAELGELKYVKRGIPPEQARLQVKQDQRTISEAERTQLIEMKFGNARPAEPATPGPPPPRAAAHSAADSP